MDSEAIPSLAQLLADRSGIDARIAALIGRPALPGHIGEWLAAKVFDIELAESATHKALDGWFRGPPQAGASVNVKLYGAQSGILDLTLDGPPDYYLVLAGPVAAAASSRGVHRAFAISGVYLFESGPLIAQLNARGVRVGVASSVRRALWEEAEVFPRASRTDLVLDTHQRAALELFDSTNDPRA